MIVNVSRVCVARMEIASLVTQLASDVRQQHLAMNKDRLRNDAAKGMLDHVKSFSA